MKAQAGFERALFSNPDFAPALFYSGVTHYRAGNLEQADERLNQFLRTHAGQDEFSDEAGRLLGAVRIRLPPATLEDR